MTWCMLVKCVGPIAAMSRTFAGVIHRETRRSEDIQDLLELGDQGLGGRNVTPLKLHVSTGNAN